MSLIPIFYLVSLFFFFANKTFDDGTNNINQKSIMYENKNINLYIEVNTKADGA